MQDADGNSTRPSGENALLRNKPPTVSVIVPSLNTEQYIADCLRSLVRQTFHDFEVIVVDDGSTDRTVPIVQHFQTLDPRILLLQTDGGSRGPGLARNLGLSTSQANYVAFVDSDDQVRSNFLETLLTAIVGHDADVAMCSLDKFSDGGNKEEFAPCSYQEVLARLSRHTFSWSDIGSDIFRLRFSSCNKLYRTSYLRQKNIRFSEGIFYEDMAFTFAAILFAERLVYVNRGLYLNRRQRTGATTNTHGDRVCDSLVAFGQVDLLLTDEPRFEQLIPAFNSFRLRKMLQYLHKNDSERIETFFAELQSLAQSIDYLSLTELKSSYKDKLDRIQSETLFEYLVREYFELSTQNAKLKRRVRRLRSSPFARMRMGRLKRRVTGKFL